MTQAVVLAFEELSRPPEAEEGAKKPRQKPTRVVRGNEGCFKTKVSCPRCRMEWGKAELGLEDGACELSPFRKPTCPRRCSWWSCMCAPADNFLMMGLKEYVCGRCACAFGCMTAEHACPHCRSEFEYHPQDYHRKINCGGKGKGSKCTKPFGFFQFKVAERREAEVRKEVRGCCVPPLAGRVGGRWR